MIHSLWNLRTVISDALHNRAALFLLSLSPCSYAFVLYAVISAWNVISRNVGGDNRGYNGITRASVSENEKEGRKKICLRSSFHLSVGEVLPLLIFDRDLGVIFWGGWSERWFHDSPIVISTRSVIFWGRKGSNGQRATSRSNVYLYPLLDGGN